MILNNTKYNNWLIYWIIITFFLIYLMILIGGATRLTDSGLSITQWELFSGIIPPLSQNDWEYYFSLYKEIPQYKLLNYNMSLLEFKKIYYWEYIHRLLGRIIGIFYILPLIFFTYQKVINKKFIYSFYIIFMLILLQGLLGWYMVKSGLTNNVTVSHYRLASHLSLAIIIISVIFWNFLNILNNKKIFFFSKFKKNFLFQLFVYLVFIQIILGAFVSGLDAGKLYQTWPLMNSSYFPNDIVISNINDLFKFEERSLVQFYHRNFAYLVCIYFIFLGFIAYRNNFTNLYNNLIFISFIMAIQIFLGIYTLLSGLNIYLAFMHQFTSVLLFLSVLYLNYLHKDININNKGLI